MGIEKDSLALMKELGMSKHMMWDEVAFEMAAGEKVQVIAPKEYFYNLPDFPLTVKPKEKL